MVSQNHSGEDDNVLICASWKENDYSVKVLFLGNAERKENLIFMESKEGKMGFPMEKNSRKGTVNFRVRASCAGFLETVW